MKDICYIDSSFPIASLRNDNDFQNIDEQDSILAIGFDPNCHPAQSSLSSLVVARIKVWRIRMMSHSIVFKPQHRSFKKYTKIPWYDSLGYRLGADTQGVTLGKEQHRKCLKSLQLIFDQRNWPTKAKQSSLK